jgi:hypothetical protein
VKNWAVPAAIIVAVEYLFALMIGIRVGFHYQIPFAAYAITALAIIGISAAIAIVVRLFFYAREGEARPTRRLLSEAPRFSGFAIGVFLVALQIGVLTWTKIMLPIASPFWADPFLANADHAIFHAEPWRVAEALFGWASPLIDKTYISWAPVKFGTLLVLVALPQTPTKTRALLSYFLLMAMVAIGQYLFSSAGPVLYAQMGFGDRFAALPLEPWVETGRAYLWQDYLRGGGKIGTGISAMPSLHVAIALWVALVLRAYKPRLTPLGLAYFAIILIGSVLLGWHYALDGIAATIIALVAWKAAQLPDHVGRILRSADELRPRRISSC